MQKVTPLNSGEKEKKRGSPTFATGKKNTSQLPKRRCDKRRKDLHLATGDQVNVR